MKLKRILLLITTVITAPVVTAPVITVILNLFIINTLSINTIAGISLTPHYRATIFQGEPFRDVSDWTTNIEVNYSGGSTKKSFNTQEAKTFLFDSHGSFDMRKLTANLEVLKEKTKIYHDGQIPDLTQESGVTKFKGNFQMSELGITLKQNIIYGIYIEGHLPIRKLKISDIDHVKTITDLTYQKIIDNFIENNLDPILEENGIKPLKTEFQKNDLSDAVLSLGWHGHCTFENSTIKRLRGFIQAGVIIPTGERLAEDRVFALPIGYNKHWGVHARGNIHASLFEKLVFGVNGGVSILARDTYDRRMTTSTEQNGYIILEKGKATTDPGTIWDITGYLKAEQIVGGLSAMIGYSYTQREKTYLTVRDDNFLKTALKNNLIYSKDYVINSNKLLNKWYQHVIHVSAEYDFGAHGKPAFSPLIRLSYNYPISAQHTWATGILSGSANLSINWRF